MNSLFTGYDNDESCHCVVGIGSPALFHFIGCVFFLSNSFFFFSYFCVDFTTCLGIDVSLSILKIKQWSCSQIPKWSFEGLVASALFTRINVTGFVQFGGKICHILPPLASLKLFAAEYLRETNISNFIYYLLMVTCSLDVLKKCSKRKETRIRKEKVEELQQTAIYSRKETVK